LSRCGADGSGAPWRRFRAVAARAPALLAALLLAAWPRAAPADLAGAAAAYDGGDYATALALWLELAEAGDLAAQLAVADLYLSGAAGTRDAALAMRWYRAAAVRGDPVAQLNLGDLLAQGIGAPHDLARAWCWLDRSAAQGRRWPAARRDRIEAQMSAEEARVARQLRQTGCLE